MPVSASCRISMAAVPPTSVTTASEYASSSASAKMPLVCAGVSDNEGVSEMPGAWSVLASRARVGEDSRRLSRRAMTHPRVDQRVDDVHDEVHQHIAHGDEHHCSLYHEVVALEDRGDRQVADARQGEDHLHDQRPTDQRAGVETGDGD